MRSVSFSPLYRTTKVETFDGNIQINRYDAEGLRYEMMENNNLVQFIFNQNREVIAEQETEWTSYIRSSTLLASSADHAKTYYHYASDEMSSITHIVDDEKVLNEYEYDAWGEVVKSTETVKNRFKFNGQQLDPITQQYYLRARFYNPVIARFTQEDTYRGDGLNLYAYCGNNPVYYVDPTGHECQQKVNSFNQESTSLVPFDPHFASEQRRLSGEIFFDPKTNRWKDSKTNKFVSTPTSFINQTNRPVAATPHSNGGTGVAYNINDGIGTYEKQKGHHPMAKIAFEGILGYNKDHQITVSREMIESFGATHGQITGQQNSLYTKFAETGKTLTVEAMREIEIKAMTNVGIPLDYATNALDKAIEVLKKSGVNQPIKIPWN